MDSNSIPVSLKTAVDGDATNSEMPNIDRNDYGKLQHLHYLSKLLPPLLRQFHNEQKEIGVEADARGISPSEVQIVGTKCDPAFCVSCNRCSTSSLDVVYTSKKTRVKDTSIEQLCEIEEESKQPKKLTRNQKKLKLEAALKKLGEEVPLTEGEINQGGESMVEGVMVEENEDKRESESVAVPNSTTEEVPTSKDQSGPVQELKDVETSFSDDTLDQFMLKKRSAAETEPEAGGYGF